MNVSLDPRDQRRLEDFARAVHKDPAVVLREIIHEALGRLREENGTSTANGEEESFLDAASRLGVVGCVKGGPPDVATHPRHMAGFGET